jgi:RibD C-terminal domain
MPGLEWTGSSADILDEQDDYRDQTRHPTMARLGRFSTQLPNTTDRFAQTDLLAHGLVDELHLMISPKIVAGDHRAFDGVAETDLRLIGVRTWGGSDNVVLSCGLGGSPR